ncbi:ATPase subunit of ABC transporter with duplicated ATPase domains [Dyadobacter sp. BE34]|uniref:ATPase subunit of ABC transporter with duplicated ATPase domains n=1 Tax=Dyadobacter fermentans TaxID=94254 RepID=A0ABU1R8I8_9BACT|nr:MULTISPECIES: ABC-F family ATP-binding cassette domain-containing protein [Dyadobacter]MDR6808915.1 ATPase subunit of ABC transporter with duplicated ATPase domains [Dyadobacter fermentans]MDR7046658.1 ATPase subunit of ABC transporter with duplicated ATPase domains [Dyadobacter sp. BE242]MDR7200972.1 ATPase subunit of ABC transporter with duplicated ATPase domains [Dyadobacter sp. BE34]MDR7218932.1 ATPase subunit of ABC transporter with duplicated ATPase domains [Dyadobacter sp. BE31]MDR72
MLFLQGVTYAHPNRDVLFSDINLTVNKQDKIALIGNNGAGKSTLLGILAGRLKPTSGTAGADSKPYFVPQLFGQYNALTIAEALGIHDKLLALREILEGHLTDINLELLDDDWGIEERCQEAFAHWQLHGISLSQPMSELSGGQKTKVFLAGIMIHEPEIVLLDEPSNHLDATSRILLYDYIRSTSNTLVIVSHDRTLLNLLDTVCELSKRGITVYGGNYDFYAAQKAIENEALNLDVKAKEKALRKAKEIEREAMERQQKLDARGKKKQEKAGLPTIVQNAFRNSAERSTARMKGIHAEKVGGIAQELSHLRSELPAADKMKLDFDNSSLHRGKILINAKQVNFTYDGQPLWHENLDFQITSGERIAIKGTNGSGKTTLIRMILGELQPLTGTETPAIMERADFKSIYIDQDYSLINNALTVYEQAQQFSSGALQEHDIKIRLNRFLFAREYWDKPCANLSGGEKMRLMLCSLAIATQAPDMIILDEPTNNLDIQNIGILTAAINEYRGTLLVVSHDAHFLREIEVERELTLG